MQRDKNAIHEDNEMIFHKFTSLFAICDFNLVQPFFHLVSLDELITFKCIAKYEIETFYISLGNSYEENDNCCII